MARPWRGVLRLLLAGAFAGGAYLAWVTAVESPLPVDLLPEGAAAVVDLRGAGELTRRLAGTRFAAALENSETRSWLEQTEFVKAFDSLRLEVGRATGWLPGRSAALDLVGDEAAAGWYPPSGDAAGSPPWVAAGRLSIRAWAAANAVRVAWGLGLGSTTPESEQASGLTVYSFPAEHGQAVHVLLAGRVLAAGSDRDLVVKAAGAAADGGPAVTREAPWKTIREALPRDGQLFLWARGPGPDALAPAARAVFFPGGFPAGALLRAEKTIEIDVAAGGVQPPDAASQSVAATTLPALGLLRRDPLFFFSSNGPVPAALAELLRARQRAAAGRGAGPAAEIRPGRGFAVAITGSAGQTGLFPTPRGAAVIGMQSADGAAAVLPSLYPAGARTAAAGGTRALSTSESIPLAGGYELWGAAIGSRLVFATETALIDTVAATAEAADPGDIGTATTGWRVRAIGTLSVEQALPLLRRWAAPLSGLLAATYPTAPDLARDLELLSALRTVRVTVGSDGGLGRAAVWATLVDQP